MRTIVTLAAVALAGIGVAACDAVTEEAPPAEAGTGRRSAAFAGADRPLVNEDWQVLRMATAHGVMTLEIELGDLDRSLEVARTLVQPLTADYAEVLVYVYAPGQGSGGHTPARRVQWTGREGYVEIAYE